MMEWGKIHFTIHDDEKFKQLSDAAQMLFIYFFSNNETAHTGVAWLPASYIAEDRNRETNDIIVALNELAESEMIEIDGDWIRVVKYLKWQPPMNPKHRKHVIEKAGKIAHRKYRQMVLEELHNGISHTVRDTIPDTVSDTVSEKSKIPYADRMPSNLSPLVSSFSLSSSNNKEEPSKKTRAKEKKISKKSYKPPKYNNDIWKLCSYIRWSYRKAGLKDITGKGSSQASTVSQFAKQQFEFNEWPTSEENTMIYIGLLYEAFMNYEGDEKDKKTGKDWIKDSNYDFSGFVSRLEKWAEKITKVTDSTGRRIYVPLKVPEDVLKFDTYGSGCDHSTARVDAFIKRNKKHAKQIREFESMARDGIKYDEYMKQQADYGKAVTDNEG